MSFEPTAPDVFQGQLQIQSDDPDYPVIEIPILGRGVAAILRVEPETYTFEAEVGDGTHTSEVTLTNQ